MSFESFYSIFREKIPQPFPELLFTRRELLDFISKQERFDVIIAGGGLHGAVCARTAALNGLKTLLLEAEDYASQTVLRIPDFLFDMASPGDLRHFFSGFKKKRQLKALMQVAPHLARAGSFLDETRFVLENMLAARQEGAACLNYARLDSVTLKRDGDVEVGWSDQISGERRLSSCGIVLNCAGACAPVLGRLTPHPFVNELETGLDVCLYCRTSGINRRNLFTLPIEAGTLIGSYFPGEKDLKDEHILEIVRRAEVNQTDVLETTSGVRVRARGSSAGKWIYGGGILHLLSGAALYAFDTAFHGIGQVFHLSNKSHDIVSLYQRPLPGGYGDLFRLVSDDSSATAEAERGTLNGDIRVAVQLEQAVTPDDVISRRLGLRMMPEEMEILRAAVGKILEVMMAD